MKKSLSLGLLLFFIFASFSFSQEEARLLRFPAVYANQVVFTYAGDLYTVSSEGGVARKLTSHDGYETFAHFSPDGKWLAFTAQYDGNTEVYLMDSQGGIPKRLTYTAVIPRNDIADRMGPNNIVMGWKHDSKHIVFRSRMKEPDDFKGQLFLTTTDGDIHRQLPLPYGGFCSFNADDSQLAYNRIFREFRTWKRYRGGMADDIWIYDFNSKKTVNITNNPAQDVFPMWKDDNIYFLSDRGPHQRMNLYVINLTNHETRRLTDFSEFNIKFPSLGDQSIAFENGGYIYLFNTQSEKLEKLQIRIADDRLHARGGIKNVKKNITDYGLSPDGKRALFGARGEIFTVPEKYGNTRNLTHSPGVHERNSQWSPDGKWIAFVSDLSGENEIYIMPQDGSGSPVQITSGADTYYYEIKWSPDSKKILWSDRKLRLRYVDIDKKTITEVVKLGIWETREFDWSPDSQWIAYRKIENPGQLSRGTIYLYSLSQGKQWEVTDQWSNSGLPVFSSCGKYLFFVSDRDYNPLEGSLDLNFIYRDMSKIYLVTLAKETPSPFQPKSDEVKVTPAPAAEPKKEKKDQKGKTTVATPVVKVDPDGLKGRVINLPINAAQYGDLVSVDNKLYYLRKGSGDEKTVLLMYDLDKQKETRLDQVDGFKISADGKKMLVAKEDSYAIIDLPAAKPEIKEQLNLKDLEMVLCLKCEWKNIFNECWRQMRDFFYVPNMHGVDWAGMKKRYEALLPHVNHRNDLTYIIGEMIGELDVGHAYVGGGERPELKTVKTGLLGAQLDRDPASGYYKITTILKGRNWDKKLVSPLTAIGVKANPGDYIIAVAGKSTAKMKNIYQALVNTVGKQVRLTLNSTPSTKGSWDAVVVPIGDEIQLSLYNWVQKNIETVTQATGGKVGYIHIRDMDEDGLNDFVKLFYPQLRKKALIVDTRFNGGGFVSEWIIERLRRRIAYYDITRYTGPTTNPEAMIYGPLVCLTDEFAGSDGDIFPYRFKKYKLGKVIGKRTWGGAVGIRSSLPLLDGGVLYKPEFAAYEVDGKNWVIEGYGVDPDIYVDNDPARQFAGIDDQLNKAIEVILEELKTKEMNIPPAPQAPDKSVKN
jgi:tricorn protease